jgi:hypothetical protein
MGFLSTNFIGESQGRRLKMKKNTKRFLNVLLIVMIASAFGVGWQMGTQNEHEKSGPIGKFAFTLNTGEVFVFAVDHYRSNRERVHMGIVSLIDGEEVIHNWMGVRDNWTDLFFLLPQKPSKKDGKEILNLAWETKNMITEFKSDGKI